MSAIATSLISPMFLTERACVVASVQRPPQPMRGMRSVSLPAACTAGVATPTSADAAAIWPEVLRNSRREDFVLGVVLINASIRWVFVNHLPFLVSFLLHSLYHSVKRWAHPRIRIRGL